MMTRADDPRRMPIRLRQQLIDEGFNDRAIARRVKDGTWARPRRGAYVDGPAWRSLDDVQQHAIVARAVLLTARTDVALSHASALGEYGVPIWNVDLSEVHVTRLDGRAGRKEAGVRQHAGALRPDDWELRGGVPVTSATRLALDMTTLVDVETSLVIVNHLLNQKLTDPGRLEETRVFMDAWPNTLHSDVVLRLADGRIESVGESRCFHLCWRQGLPLPEPQYKIRDASGRVVARVDFAWPQLGVFLEFDGMVKYGKLLREGETASDVVVREKRREELICRLTGWRCIRLVWADLFTPEVTAARIREQLFPMPMAS